MCTSQSAHAVITNLRAQLYMQAWVLHVRRLAGALKGMVPHPTVRGSAQASLFLLTSAPCLQPKFFKGKYQDTLTTFQLPLQVATEREIARQQYQAAGQQTLSEWAVRLKDFPHPALSTNSLIGQVLGPFLFAASMFSYVPVVSPSPTLSLC